MTLKQFMDANTNNEALVSLVNDGQAKPFAKVTDGSIGALANSIQGRNVVDFTVQSPSAITVRLEGASITLSAVDGMESLFEVPVSDMQTGVEVNGYDITGTLKNLTGDNALTERWGEGNFLCLQFSAEWSDYSSVKVGLDPSASGMELQEILTDPDKNGAFKITNKAMQKFKVVAVKDGETYTFTYDLSNLIVE